MYQSSHSYACESNPFNPSHPSNFSRLNVSLASLFVPELVGVVCLVTLARHQSVTPVTLSQSSSHTHRMYSFFYF